MIRATLYFLDGKGNVSQVREMLASIQEDIPHELIEIDVAQDSALQAEYERRVPVIEVGSFTLNAPFSEIDLRVAFGATKDSLRPFDANLPDEAGSPEPEQISGAGSQQSAAGSQQSAASSQQSAAGGQQSAAGGQPAAAGGQPAAAGGQQSAAGGQPAAAGGQAWGMRLNRGVRFFSRHWLAAFSLVVFIYAGLPFMAPTLMKVGATGPARAIYTLYSPFCHQFAFRSFFLYGPQAAYPRELAGTDLVSYGEATGMDEQDVIGARRYVGDETVGYKTALCERDIGIYLGIFLAGLAYGAVRNRRSVVPLPLRYWFLIGIVPIALDGGTQLISQLGIFPFAARESTPLLRTATGLLFGAMNVWMAYPHVDQAMRETFKTTSAKIAVAEQRSKQIPQ